MRLTLRVLLSYLDDMLEPAQAKLIGAKVAESEQAREQMERIKQVTRRRRLTTPTASGPGGIDPNTIAEYLDNEVTPETATEVEQICLASDVHLAEVAACHQILTLVLGEPALVPPTAKQRMYGLVKGPESISLHKHVKSRKQTQADLSSEIDLDTDDSLRLGISLGGMSKQQKLWLIVGGGVLAACLLVGVIWMLVANINPADPTQHAQVDPPKEDPKPPKQPDPPPPKDKQNGGPPKDKKLDDPPKDKQNGGPPKDKNNDPPKDKQNGGPPKDKQDNDPPKDKQTEPKIEVIPVKVEPTPEIAYKPAIMKEQPIGKYQSPTPKEPGVLLQSSKAAWVTFVGKNPPVFSGRQLLSLPGSKSVIKLDSGAELMLWGNLPELTYDAMLAESLVVLHPHDQLDADLTLQRGRILLRNPSKDKSAMMRVRIDNPTLGEEHYFDLALRPEAEIVLERLGLPDDAFHENPKDKMRKGPTAVVLFYAKAKSTRVRSGMPFTIDEAQTRALEWHSRRGTLVTMPAGRELPVWLTNKAPKNDIDPKDRKKAVEVANALSRSLESKGVDVAIEEFFQDVQGKPLSFETFFVWRQAIQCAGAVDDLGRVYDEFQNETTPMYIRFLCMRTMEGWLGWQRSNDQVLLKVIEKRHRRSEPTKIMELLHPIPFEDAAKNPEKFQYLIDSLGNDVLSIRALSYFQLMRLAPAGREIPYDAAMPRAERDRAVRAWHDWIPPGKLPPDKPPTKKTKS